MQLLRRFPARLIIWIRSALTRKARNVEPDTEAARREPYEQERKRDPHQCDENP